MSGLKCVVCGSANLYARSRCRVCYLRLRQALKEVGEFKSLLPSGDPLGRLLARAERAPSGCLLLRKASASDGYGRIRVDGRLMLAHRAAYDLIVGPIPDGLGLDHTCHNQDPTCRGGAACIHRRCIAVEHLEPVPGPENTRRGKSWLINGSKTHCPQGHPYDTENTNLYDGRRYCRTCQGRRPRGDAA